MKYYIRQKDGDTGPYTKEQLAELLGSLKIGRQTLCRPADGSTTRSLPLDQILPGVVEAVNRSRSRGKQIRTGALVPLNDRIMLTTETAFTDLVIDQRLSVITSEVAMGLNVFKDLATVARDIVGGRSKTIQNAFADARKVVLDEMRREADSLGAHAVIGIDFKYSEISSGRSMLLIVGVGTAVTLKREDSDASE